MRYFEPEIALAANLPPQSEYQDKFGGLPWGLPVDRWPLCRSCKRPQSLIAQLAHHPIRLDLGREGRVLHVFMCGWWPDETCLRGETYDPSFGGNACVIFEAAQLGRGIIQPPSPSQINPELRVMQWLEKDDGLPQQKYKDFFDYDAWLKMSEQDFNAGSHHTKLGGAPDWLQAPEGPNAPWRFALQIDENCYFRVPPAPSEHVRDVHGNEYSIYHFEKETDYRWAIRVANFGVGRAYVFVNTDVEPPEGMFLWQR